MTLTSGSIMTRIATEESMVLTTTLTMLRGFGMNAAEDRAIMKVVSWGHMLKRRMCIKRCGAEAIDKREVTLVHTDTKTKGIGRRARHSRSADSW